MSVTVHFEDVPIRIKLLAIKIVRQYGIQHGYDKAISALLPADWARIGDLQTAGDLHDDSDVTPNIMQWIAPRDVNFINGIFSVDMRGTRATRTIPIQTEEDRQIAVSVAHILDPSVAEITFPPPIPVAAGKIRTNGEVIDTKQGDNLVIGFHGIKNAPDAPDVLAMDITVNREFLKMIINGLESGRSNEK